MVNHNNLHTLSNFATKARFLCDLYTYHISSAFAVTKLINLILEGIRGLDNETILESDCAIDQHDEVSHRQLTLIFL
nr:hypothetical protein [Wolbachia endosymbiont of Brugia malayi]